MILRTLALCCLFLVPCSLSLAAVAFPDVSASGRGVQPITPGPPDIGTEAAVPPPSAPEDPDARARAIEAHRGRVAQTLAEQRVHAMAQGNVDPDFPSPEIDLTDPSQRAAAVEWYILQLTPGFTAEGVSVDYYPGREAALALHRARVEAMRQRRGGQAAVVTRLSQNLLALLDALERGAPMIDAMREAGVIGHMPSPEM